MDIKTNKKIFNEIIEESKSDALLLNEIIDGEMKRDNADYDLIDECVDTILEFKGTEVSSEIPNFRYSDDKKNNKTVTFGKTLFRLALVAAVVLATTLTANAAVKGVTNKGIIENIAIAVSKDKTSDTTTTPQITTDTTTTTTTEKTTIHNSKPKHKKKSKIHKKKVRTTKKQKSESLTKAETESNEEPDTQPQENEEETLEQHIQIQPDDEEDTDSETEENDTQ